MTAGSVAIVGLAAILMAGLVSLARIVTDNQTRQRLVDRGLSSEEILILLRQPASSGEGALRIALVLVATGGALVVAQYLPFGSRDPFSYGLVIAAAGLGLFLSQRLLRGRSDSSASHKHEEQS